MRIFSIIKYVFLIIGAALLTGAFFLYQNKSAFLEKAVSVQGTVIEMVAKRSDNSTTYSPVISFKTKSGQEITFSSSISSNPPSYSVNETVEVLYNPADPKEANINTFSSLWIGPLILGGIGIVFFLIGSLSILFGYLKKKKAANLRGSGKLISTKFTHVELNSSLSANGRNPFQIYSQWQDPQTNELYVFKSENIWFDPTDFVKTDTLKVFIDPQNPKNYTMDTSFLPILKN
ncbi:DUF3592 domain-containing protein [Flavobacterium sp. ACN6]|uniref:DUF3592 domain-containing protein n=1 Tax=Flavobacterium sp. ACN6 TaxID=1920426 RepID=UPI000BB36666|nr:DUF3592 domain-containing protein [Flavobacterium sp. ACN6]PBJ09034.1 Inner membrane protein YmfA [Flavobacterium sp. ACN6]